MISPVTFTAGGDGNVIASGTFGMSPVRGCTAAKRSTEELNDMMLPWVRELRSRHLVELPRTRPGGRAGPLATLDTGHRAQFDACERLCDSQLSRVTSIYHSDNFSFDLFEVFMI